MSRLDDLDLSSARVSDGFTSSSLGCVRKSSVFIDLSPTLSAEFPIFLSLVICLSPILSAEIADFLSPAFTCGVGVKSQNAAMEVPTARHRSRRISHCEQARRAILSAASLHCTERQPCRSKKNIPSHIIHIDEANLSVGVSPLGD